ncbi:hypothetical protein JW851_00260 [Candidatus Woesearchaeota archaeon]|nr:hypothetical protein [Candidatus Woesearchaeota archaeon]
MKKIIVLIIILLITAPLSNAEIFRLANVKTSPSKIDRRTATITEVPVQIQTVFLQTNPREEAKIISAKAKCESEDLIDYFIIKETTRTPIIITKLMPATEKNSTEINCTIQLKILQNNNTIEEEKQIQQTIQLYSNPLGEINENIQNKINQINEDIHDFEKQIAHLERTNRVLGQIASYSETAAKGDAIITQVLGVIWPIAVALEEIPTPYTKAAGRLLWNIAGKGLHSGHTFVLWAIWNPGYSITGASTILSTFTKTLTIMQSCQLCDYSETHTALIEQAAGEKIFTLDDKHGEPTTIEQFTIYEWEPYKSIHVAQACLCLPAISYNLEKEKQIKCIYKNCIEQNAEYGFPLTECEKTLKQQQCLYVDGAAWKISGGNAAAQIFSEITNTIMKQLPVIFAGEIWQNLCDYETGVFSQEAYPETFGQPNILSDMAVPLCAATAGMQMLQETGFFKGNKYKWDQYTGKLKGDDYC